MTEQPDVIIHFPKPPSANRMFLRQMTRRGHRDLTPEYKAWRDEAGWILKMQIVGLVTITIVTKFNIVVIEVPRSSRIDLDNQSETNPRPRSEHGRHLERPELRHGITMTPADRDDCMAAFWCLPDVGMAARVKRTPRLVVPKAKRAALTWKLPA